MNISVLPVNKYEATPWIMEKHYAKRMPPVSYAFGAYDGNELIGIVTYGVPVSSPLRAGVCGHLWLDKVLELNRLCCVNKKNIASILVGRSLSMLPRPSIVVSYADTGQGHIGYVYQATNFIYTGLSAKRTDWKLKGQESLHGATVADMSRGHKNRAEWMREKFGDDFYLEERSRKHRYIYFCGSKADKKNMVKDFNYKQEPYPKGESMRYDSGEKVKTQLLLFAK